jgi:GNAT superfamily N-acetyltransferase
MASREVTVYYLEMRSHARRVVPLPRPGLSVAHVESPSVTYYRWLYDEVGRDYHWLGRKKLSDAELASLLADPLDEVHALAADGVTAGFAELDRRVPGEVELVQFGLLREFIGRGLGKYFLQWVIDRSFGYGVGRLWLHTCTLDHPAALPNYLKAGFALYRQEKITRDV